jgi:hypothetical protein
METYNELLREAEYQFLSRVLARLKETTHITCKLLRGYNTTLTFRALSTEGSIHIIAVGGYRVRVIIHHSYYVGMLRESCEEMYASELTPERVCAMLLKLLKGRLPSRSISA